MALQIEKEDDLFVRMQNYQERHESWYKLSENNDVSESDTLLLPCFQQIHPHCHDLSSQIAVGPFIFVIGGTRFGHSFRWHNLKRDVYFIDTRNPAAGWKKGPKLLSGRAGAYPFLLGKTICLLGGSFIERHPYGQVLDLKTLKWKLFKTNLSSTIFPPMGIYLHGIRFNKDLVDSEEDKRCVLDESILYDYDNVSARCHPSPKELYVHSSHDLYCYDFETAFWKIVEKPVNSRVYRTSVSVDDVMYVLDDESLMGYSMSKGIWFDVSLSGFDKYNNTFPTKDSDYAWWSLPPCCILHLGNGILCILWAIPTLPPENAVLHCTKFTVKLDGELPVAAAAVEVTLYRTYKLPPGTMLDCVAVSASSTITLPFVESSCEVDLVESGSTSSTTTFPFVE